MNFSKVMDQEHNGKPCTQHCLSHHIPHSLPNREESLYEEGDRIVSFPDPLFICLCLSLPLAGTKWKLAFSQSDNEQPVLVGKHGVLRGDFQNRSPGTVSVAVVLPVKPSSRPGPGKKVTPAVGTLSRLNEDGAWSKGKVNLWSCLGFGC